ncbi:MAG: ATP-binding protein [Opitutaceae bacterium]
MSHILLISHHASIPQKLQEAFTAIDLIVVAKQSATEATSALERNAFDLVILHSDSDTAHLRSELRNLGERAPDLSIIVISERYSIEEEQEAFELGAELYFSEPLPIRSLQRIIKRHTASISAAPETTPHHTSSQPAHASKTPSSALQILRDFSNILGFSLDFKAFTQHFVLKLREHISFTRIGIFLEAPAKQSLVKDREHNHLQCIASLGLPNGLIDCFQLSRDVGIGKILHADPRIINLEEINPTGFGGQGNAMRKEFNILGCQLAVPISDREGTIGVAMLNGPVTGREYQEDELQLLYLLMEELGLAIRNSRLHTEIQRHGALIEKVLSSMSSGAIVISEDLNILYTNRAAKDFFDLDNRKTGAVEFAELPTSIATPLHRAVENGELTEPFRISNESDERIYQVSIFPFSNNEELALLPQPTMVIIEDFTKVEASKQSALEDTKAALISLIAERFAHEIRNSLVPLTTHMQLMDKKIEQPKFQASLKLALQNETGRIKRFSEQMLYLAQNSNPSSATCDIVTIIRNSFESAKSHANRPRCHLITEAGPESAIIHGDGEALTYAFEELLLNAIQSTDDNPLIYLNLQQDDESILNITLRDSGSGFSTKSLEHGIEPFYTSRSAGVGLGLSVAKKIIETHNGFLILNQRNKNHNWDIKIQFPISSPQAAP